MGTKGLGARPESGPQHFCLHFMGGNSSHVATPNAREAGKCSIAVCLGRRGGYACCQSLSFHRKEVLVWPLGRGFLPFLCTHTCSGESAAAIAA